MEEVSVTAEDAIVSVCNGVIRTLIVHESASHPHTGYAFWCHPVS